MTSSQNSSQRIRADDMTEEQLTLAALNVTAFILCDTRSKKKLRKEDIVTNALNKSSRQYAIIMKMVQNNLSDVSNRISQQKNLNSIATPTFLHQIIYVFIILRINLNFYFPCFRPGQSGHFVLHSNLFLLTIL